MVNDRYFRRGKNEMTEPKRILITRTDRLGDVVLSTPVIRFLRDKYPSAYIAFMVRPYTKDVVEHDPHLDEVIVYDKLYSQRSFLGTLKFAMRLRNKRFDMAIALHPTNRVHIMLFLAAIPVRIGYNRKMGALLTKRVVHDKQKGRKHEVDNNFDLLAKAGFDVSEAERRPYIVTHDREKSVVDVVIRDQGIGDKIIAVHAGASCPSKRWPPERFAQVCDALASDFRHDIVLVGGSDTRGYSRMVSSKMKSKAFDLTAMLRVGELAELLSRCRVFISNDSGPVHISVAVGTPVVCVFGRNDPGLSPARWGPLGKEDIVLHKDVGCEKCLAHNCLKDFACLKAITADEVIDAAGKILSRSSY